jgi:hypothetical protein
MVKCFGTGSVPPLGHTSVGKIQIGFDSLNYGMTKVTGWGGDKKHRHHRHHRHTTGTKWGRHTL